LLDTELSWLVTPAAKNGYRFGYRLGRADAGFSLLSRLLQAQERAGDLGSVFFVGGYLRALHETDIERWEATLDELTEDERFLRWVPELTWRSGVTERAAVRMIEIAERGLVPASSLRMFAFGGALRNVSQGTIHRWMDFLLGVGEFETVSIALELFTFYYHGDTVNPPKEMALKLLLAPPFFQRSERHQRTDMMTYEWSELAKKIVRRDPDAGLELADVMLQHFGEDGTIVEGFFSQTQHILDDVLKVRPRETWKLITKYLGPPIDGRAFHITSWLRGDEFNGEGQGVLSMVPVDALWQWVDEDIEKRAWYLATFVPKFLSHGAEPVSLAREILVRYGRRADVRQNLISNFSTEGWTGPESLHYQVKRDRLLAFRKEESNANVNRWIDEYVDGLNRQIARAKVEEERRH